jgi:hypothetical protein
MDWQTFQKYFCDPNAADSYRRISTLLSYTMMRRTMKTTILNRPIITLPPPHPEIQYIQFAPEEQLIYRIVSVIVSFRFRHNLANSKFRPKTAFVLTLTHSLGAARPAATTPFLWFNSYASANALPTPLCLSELLKNRGPSKMLRS